MKMIIDTDAGVDDAQAIMLALMQADVDVLAITTLTGNVHIRQVNPNVLTILEIMDRDVPVYAGIDRPLISEWEDAAEFHGGDGLGDYRDRPSLTRKLEDEHAVLALLRLSREYEGELTLIALGPLTNLAAAIRLDPAFPARIKQFVFMGGTIAAHGNTPIVTAEYNIWTDPEAAHITLAAFEDATMLSWETTLAHGFVWDKFNSLCAIDTVNGRFFDKISSKTAAAPAEYIQSPSLSVARSAGDGYHFATGAYPPKRQIFRHGGIERSAYARANRHRLQPCQRQDAKRQRDSGAGYRWRLADVR